MADYFEYISKGSQRWDMISYQWYGTADKSGDIIRFNPDVPVYDVLPDGTLLHIPILETTAVQTDAEKLPPWKRS